MKLALGTVQFGLDYGVSNDKGKTPVAEVKNILKTAQENSIYLLDTATLYGESEKVLGLALPEIHEFQIVTKTPQFKSDEITKENTRELRVCFEQSLHNLKQKKIYSLLIHNANDILVKNGQDLYKEMVILKQMGYVKKIGVSVYDSNQIDSIIDKYDIDLIQLPLNVLDQRLLKSGHLKALKQRDIEIHVRSVFLQGILLMSSKSIPSYFKNVIPLLEDYKRTLDSLDITLQESAINFVKSIPEVDKLIIGINDGSQLIENIIAYKKSINLDYNPYSCTDLSIIDPRKWCLE